MKTIAFHALKGGVGKTTAAVNVAYLAAHSGLRTLLCDLDPQAAASFYLQADGGDLSAATLVKGGHKVEEAVRPTDYAGLDILPGSIAFRNLAVTLAEAKKSRKQLRSTLERFADYDLIVIDSPAGLTVESASVFRASDLVLVPSIPSTLSVNALRITAEFVRRESHPPEVRSFLCMADARRKLHREFVESLASDPLMLHTVIPNASEVEKMGVYRAPLCARRPADRASLAFAELWNEIRALLDLDSVS